MAEKEEVQNGTSQGGDLEHQEFGLQTEKSSSEEEDTNLKTRDGIVLRPQPSDDPDDPLNWSSFRKHMAMATISYLALVCYVAVTSLVPATLSLATAFGVPKATAVYLGNTPVALYAVGPLLWSPLSHFVGRRPVLLLCNVIAIVGTAVAASANTYGTCMGGRVILGLGGSAFWTLGPASIGDIFFRHEKGKKVGISTLAIVVAPFLGGIAGGAILNNPHLSWRWTEWIPLILMGAGLIAQIFFLPETIYIRNRPATAAVTVVGSSVVPPSAPTFWGRYGVHIPKRHQDAQHSFWFVFTRPFVMFRFPAVVLAAFWFGVAYMMHVGITAEIPLIFEPAPYNFSQLDVGLSAFSGLIGALVGEVFAGPMLDAIAKRNLRRELPWKPELRLQAIWPALIAVPVGLMMFGVSIQFAASWVPALVGQGIYIFGIEIATTVVQTYILECYPQQGAEASLVFNLCRNLMSYTAPFFLSPMLVKLKGSLTFSIFSIFTVAFFPVTIGVLMWRGDKIREKSGNPGWSRD
ncbi:major facilitator superfamily domain-containing protein [Xylariales sp. PMI_506]|nr:major facilitator superfamily domain-containing protein [Xylariales sp. PMI_506]